MWKQKTIALPVILIVILALFFTGCIFKKKQPVTEEVEITEFISDLKIAFKDLDATTIAAAWDYPLRMRHFNPDQHFETIETEEDFRARLQDYFIYLEEESTENFLELILDYNEGGEIYLNTDKNSAILVDVNLKVLLNGGFGTGFTTIDLKIDKINGTWKFPADNLILYCLGYLYCHMY